MAPRPHWKGFLKLSLVSCPIALYPAVSPAERISFRQVNKQTGNRLRHQLVDSVTGEVVQSQDKGRGYEIGQNQFLVVRDEELAAVREEARSRPYSSAPAPHLPRRTEFEEPARASKTRGEEPAEVQDEAAPEVTPPPAPTPPPRIENNRTIELDRFFPRDQLDPRYFNAPYYIAPRDVVGQEAFAVIRDAMAETGLVGMGRVILSNRERPIIIEPMGNGLCGITLHHTHEVRNKNEYFADIPKLTLPDEMLDVAKHILKTKTADFDPAFLEDRYRTAVAEMLRDKQAQLPRLTTPSPTPTPQNVINLMDVLKRSLAAEQPSASAARRPPAASKPSRGKRSASRKRTAG
jgi:non-homologous end joining protein Ku